MTNIYEGPTRHEILHQILKYNQHHHKIDNILVSNASKSSDLIAIQQLQKDERNASESARQLKVSIKDLQVLKRHQLKKGSVSSRTDWAHVLAVGKKLVDTAENGMARCDAKAGAVEAHGRQKMKEDLSQRVLKPTSPHSPKLEPPTRKPYRPFSPATVSTHKPPQQPSSPRQEDLSKRVLTPRREIPDQKPYPPSPQPASPKQGEKKLQPQATVKLQEKRPLSPEAKGRQRQFIIGQKEMMAHLQAKKLHDEVRGGENEW